MIVQNWLRLRAWRGNINSARTRRAMSLIAAALTLGGATPVRAQGENVSAALRAALQARAGHYPLVEITVFPHDSALLVFEDSSYTGKAAAAAKRPT